MESCSSKPSVVGSSVWGLTDTFPISSRSSPLMLNMMPAENMHCAVCSQRNETLVKREEIVWQREDLIHIREKELRERELILQEKDTRLKDEQMRLKYEEERLKEEYDSEESRKWKNFNMEEYVSFILQKSNELKNDFLMEKERLLQNKEHVNLVKEKLLQTQELELLRKEQVLSDEKSIVIKERALSDERNLSIENRENIVKALERELHSKITEALEKEKSLDDKVNLIEKKETALSVAAEMMAKKERELHERENNVIEKERDIIKQIVEFVSAVKSEENDQVLKENDGIHIYFDKIINDKVLSLHQQENAIEQREKILEEKWKAYADTQELLKLQQKTIFEKKNSCEKEKLMLKEWSEMLEKQDKVIIEKINSLETALAEKSYQNLFTNNNISSDLFASSKTEAEISRNSSPFPKLGTESGNSSDNSDQKLSAEKVSVSQNLTVDSKYENTGEEFLNFLEKKKEELQNVLLSEETEKTTVEISNKSSGGKTSAKTVELIGPVKEIFDIASNISTTISNDQIVSAEVKEPLFLQAINKSSTKKVNSSETTLAEKSHQTLFTNNDISSDLFASSKTRVEISRNSSPFPKLGTESGNSSDNSDQKLSAEEVGVSQNVTVNSKYENSGETFLKALATEKELQNVLPSEETEKTTAEIPNKSSGGKTSAKTEELIGPVKEFFDLASNISTKIGTDQIVSAEVKEPMFSAINTSATTTANSFCREVTQNIAFVRDAEVTKLHSGDVNIHMLPSQRDCIPTFTGISSDGQKIDNCLLYGEAHGNVQNEEKNDCEQNLKGGLEITKDTVKIECNQPTVLNVGEHENSSECSTENALNKQVDSSLKTYTERNKSHAVIESVSSCSSPSSTRSLTSPIPDNKLKTSGARKKKIERDSLLKAIVSGNNLEIVNLLDMNYLPLELRDDEGRSAFLLAVETGNIELAERLIKMGADIRASDYNGNSALHIAVSEKNCNMVIFLIKGGLNPHVTNNDGNSALELASRTSDVLLVDTISKLISVK